MLSLVLGRLYEEDPLNADGFIAWEFNQQYGERAWNVAGTRVPHSALEHFDGFAERMVQETEALGGCFMANSVIHDKEVKIAIFLPNRLSPKEFLKFVRRFEESLKEFQIVCRAMRTPIGPQMEEMTMH